MAGFFDTLRSNSEFKLIQVFAKLTGFWLSVQLELSVEGSDLNRIIVRIFFFKIIYLKKKVKQFLKNVLMNRRLCSIQQLFNVR